MMVSYGKEINLINMFWKKSRLVTCLIMVLGFGNNVLSQLTSGQVQEKQNKVSVVKTKELSSPEIGVRKFYLGAGLNTAFRSLTESKGYFAEPLGMRVDEFAENRWVFQAGCRNRFAPYFTLDAGFQIERYGLGYSYQSTETDSAFTYSMSFSYVAVPMQIFFTYGKNLRWYVGGGIQPMLASTYAYKNENTFSNGTKVGSSYSSVESLNPFVLNVMCSGGVEWNWGKNTSFYFLPSYVYGLTNIYGKQEPYRQYWHGVSYKFGLVLRLDHPVVKNNKP